MAFTTTKTGWTEEDTRYTIYVRTFRLATSIQKLPVRRVDPRHTLTMLRRNFVINKTG